MVLFIRQHSIVAELYERSAGVLSLPKGIIREVVYLFLAKVLQTLRYHP